VTITADPPPGMGFVRWAGPDVPPGRENNRSFAIHMLGPRTLWAEFETLYTPSGIPQPWFFAANLAEAEENADPDGDRVSNAGEYHAGTDPMNPADFPRIADCRVNPETGRLEWPSKAGHRYSIETAPAVAGPWTVMVEDAVATPPLNSATLPGGPQDGFHLFRIVTERE